MDDEYHEDRPRCMRWTTVHASENRVQRYRLSIDRYTQEQVIWTPYTAHRSEQRPFEERAWFSGYLHCFDTVQRHLPERWARQYGHVQSIPRSPHALPFSGDVCTVVETWQQRWEAQLILEEDRGALADPAWQAVQEYITWYDGMSHPYVDPIEAGLRAPMEAAGPSVAEDQADDAANLPAVVPEGRVGGGADQDDQSWQHRAMAAAGRFADIASQVDAIMRMDTVMGDPVLYSALYDVWASAMAGGDGPGHQVYRRKVRQKTDGAGSSARQAGDV